MPTFKTAKIGQHRSFSRDAGTTKLCACTNGGQTLRGLGQIGARDGVYRYKPIKITVKLRVESWHGTCF